MALSKETPNAKKTQHSQFVDSISETQLVENDSSIELIFVDDQNAEISESWLYTQISEQIREMTAAVLTNSEKQKCMEFELKNQPTKYLSVVQTAPDGNCLFSALAHQLWKNKINHENHKKSKGEHEQMIAKLRSAVVEHILPSENFPMYETFLQDRLSELKDLNTVNDLTAECKLYVRNVLSCEGKWVGMETIKAISFMHRVNVLVINECGTCYLIKGSKERYDLTLLIVCNRYVDCIIMMTTIAFIIITTA